MLTTLELIPNRQLLDSNFDGYKLSLQEIPMKKLDFTIPVDRVLLNPQQCSILHANLFGYHNHLISDIFDEINSVYYIDKEFNICKIYMDPLQGDLINPLVVLKLRKNRERQTGDYNTSLKFVSSSTAVIGDGIGTLYIINTGNRNDDEEFSICFSDEVIGEDTPFIILDAVLKVNNDNQELHVLALSLEKSKNEKFFALLHWISFKKIQDAWEQAAIKQIKTKGCVQYAYIEKNCEAIYVVSDDECGFILNSDVPIVEKTVIPVEKVYKWSQNIEDITIKIPLPPDTNKRIIRVDTENTYIKVKCGEIDLIKGELYQRIDPDLTTWTLIPGLLEISLYKSETGLMWPELVKNDHTGEHVVDSCIVEEVHARLGHLTSESESMPQCGSTFNSQQVEECDFENDKTFTFERLCGKTNRTTHKINLGTNQVLLCANLSPDLVPAVGIRYDVDICLWQPHYNETFSITHEGTLLALGYVQASKQNRKYTVCPPDMNYAVICETNGHLFIYRQNRSITNTELRNRTTGRRVQKIAQQQVVNLCNEEIIGIYASNTTLFLLCEKSIIVLRI
ncbi:nudC domain-containing protein 1 [Diorhabda carinulata]|uniref:nudC domain-containing protein 1 n=1 Tax=Diorhabda carinulata TaxID=1163345 RepID=UPI0025A25791|nr:nudC domain-containing protein 1 [Diorhabda carinulata]